MDDELLREKVVAAVTTGAGLAPHQCINPALHLLNDLGVDSLSLLLIIRTLEKEFGITIPDEETGRTRTVGDLIATIQRLAGSDRPAGPTR